MNDKQKAIVLILLVAVLGGARLVLRTFPL